MRSSAQPKYACGVFGSKESVYNRYRTVVNKFVENPAGFGLKCYNPILEGFLGPRTLFRRSEAMVASEKEQHLGAKGFIEFLDVPSGERQIASVQQHCGAAIVKFG